MTMSPRPPASADHPAAGTRDAESLFRTKPIVEIRAAEFATRREIEEKKEELRQLVGLSYRDLIDSADTILFMRSSCESISSNFTQIEAALRSLSLSPSPSDGPATPTIAPNPARAQIYRTASRVKYLVDTPENIWGCLDESMLLEAACRYLRAGAVHGLITCPNSTTPDPDALTKFPLLRHQWQIVESFKAQISQRSRERLTERGLPVAAYADALAAAATIDNLDPRQVLCLFLDSRSSWISQKLAGLVADSDSSPLVLCDAVRMIRSSLGQVGELFVLALNEMPLFYKTVLGSPPGTQLFGGIPNPDEEVRLWKSHRDKLESVMVLLEPEFIAEVCSSWLTSCCDKIFGELPSGKHLIDAIASGEGLGSAEKSIRGALDSREGLEESLEQWLRSVFGSEIESPWNQLCGLILKDGKDVLEDRMEEAFVKRMKEIVQSGFEDLSRDINVRACIEEIVGCPKDGNDFRSYLKKPSTGGVWFSEPNHGRIGPGYSLKLAADESDFCSCLNAYLGPEVSHIRDAVDNKCGNILEDLLCFIESHNSTLRLKELAQYLQDNCYNTVSAMVKELEDVLSQLSTSLENKTEEKESQPSSVIVERSLFIGRLLFSLRNHSSYVPLILGSPRQWAKETSGAAFGNQLSAWPRQSKAAIDSPVSFSPRRKFSDSPRSPKKQYLDIPRRQIISAAATLFASDDSTNPKLAELNRSLQELCFRAHSLWITWVSSELAIVLSRDLNKDEALSALTPLRGWEVTVIKQEQPSEGTLEMKISLPSLPSLYITSFLFHACLEIHKVGGHILDKFIQQYLAWRLLEKVVGIYENFLPTVEASDSRVSEKGILQILLDLRFIAEILSGGKDSTSSSSELNAKEEPSKNSIHKTSLRRKQTQLQPSSASTEPIMKLIHRLSQKLDPIDWATYEPYLWENERQSYKRFTVLFGFFVQLNRVYTDTELKYKSNTDSNILRCSSVPRFKYLPISAPALSSRGTHKSILQTSTDDASSRSPWKAYSNGEQSPKADFDESVNFGVATPLLKSFMTQVGSKVGESTSRWGSMLYDGQVGKAAMSTFGDMLPGPAAGLLSSLTSGAGRFDS